ncbi:hypothetical protein KC321_g18992 [Hortaea werneckii]|nr:hypothetical protein KC321_g18992 [Hortaea werneckii]
MARAMARTQLDINAANEAAGFVPNTAEEEEEEEGEEEEEVEGEEERKSEDGEEKGQREGKEQKGKRQAEENIVETVGAADNEPMAQK